MYAEAKLFYLRLTPLNSKLLLFCVKYEPLQFLFFLRWMNRSNYFRCLVFGFGRKIQLFARDVFNCLYVTNFVCNIYIFKSQPVIYKINGQDNLA